MPHIPSPHSSSSSPSLRTRHERRRHGRERRERRGFVRRSVRFTRCVGMFHVDTRVHRRRTWVNDPVSSSSFSTSPFPSPSTPFVWTNPTEVMEEGRRMRVLGSRRWVYPLRLLEMALVFLPGLRPHEHRSLRRGLLRRRRLGRLGVRFSVRWRIPSSWIFFVRFSEQWEGLDAMPRLSSYRGWWSRCIRRGVIFLHLPRGRRRLIRRGSSSFSRLSSLESSRDRRVRRRRPRRFGSFVVGALRTPPDVRSQRRVALPRVFRVERRILGRCVQTCLIREQQPQQTNQEKRDKHGDEMSR